MKGILEVLNCRGIIDSLDNLADDYLNEINTYTKKYIDDNLSSLVSLVALYQQVAPSVYVLNPMKDISYFRKVDSSLFSQYPEYEPVISLHSQVTGACRRWSRTQSPAPTGSGATGSS